MQTNWRESAGTTWSLPAGRFRLVVVTAGSKVVVQEDVTRHRIYKVGYVAEEVDLQALDCFGFE